MYFTLNSVLLSLISSVHPITLCVMTVKCCLIVNNGFCMIFDLCLILCGEEFWLSSVFGKPYTFACVSLEQHVQIWSRKPEMQSWRFVLFNCGIVHIVQTLHKSGGKVLPWDFSSQKYEIRFFFVVMWFGWIALYYFHVHVDYGRVFYISNVELT